MGILFNPLVIVVVTMGGAALPMSYGLMIVNGYYGIILIGISILLWYLVVIIIILV